MYLNSYLLKCNLLVFFFFSVFGKLSAQELSISAPQMQGHWFGLYVMSNSWVGSDALLISDTLDQEGNFSTQIETEEGISFLLDFGWRQVSFYWSGKDDLHIEVDRVENYYDFTAPYIAHIIDKDQYDSLFSITEYLVSETIQQYYKEGSFKKNWKHLSAELEANRIDSKDSLVQLNFDYAVHSLQPKSGADWLEMVNTAPLNFQLPAIVDFHESAKEYFGGIWFVQSHDLIKNVIKNGQGYSLFDTLSVTKYQDLSKDRMHLYLLMNLKSWKKDMGISSDDLGMYLDYLKEEFVGEKQVIRFIADYEKAYLHPPKSVMNLADFSFVHLPSSEIFNGRYVYLMSWSTWSMYSTERLDLLNRLQEEYRETIVFVAVNVDEEYSKEVQAIESRFPQMIFAYKGGDYAWLKEWSWMTNSPPNYILLDGTGNVAMYNALDVLDMLGKFDDINDAFKQQKIDLMQNGVH